MSTGDNRKPVRVLLICDSYPPVLGGSEVEAQRVSAAMIRRGHQVRVLCAGGPPMPPVRDWIDPAGVPVSILTRNTRGRRKDLAFAWEVARAIWRGRRSYDVVYFLMQGLHLAAGLPVARLARLPMLMKFGGSGVVPLMRRSRAGRLELNWMREWNVRLMVLNQGMMEEALADGFSRKQLYWMPNPVDIEEFRPAIQDEAAEFRRRQDIPPSACVVVYVGRLSQEKGLPELLRGFAGAARQSPDALLLLIGDGAQRQQLEVLATELGIHPRQIRFVGRVDSRQVPFWLRAADIFALTSPSEGFSCALLEAMASGLASVVSAIPANLQLVEEGVQGLTAPFGDVGHLERVFLRLFLDPELRSGMGRAARSSVAAQYSTDRVVDLYEDLFAEVIGLR